jgi:hypothetical protein
MIDSNAKCRNHRGTGDTEKLLLRNHRGSRDSRFYFSSNLLLQALDDQGKKCRNHRGTGARRNTGKFSFKESQRNAGIHASIFLQISFCRLVTIKERMQEPQRHRGTEEHREIFFQGITEECRNSRFYFSSNLLLQALDDQGKKCRNHRGTGARRNTGKFSFKESQRNAGIHVSIFLPIYFCRLLTIKERNAGTTGAQGHGGTQGNFLSRNHRGMQGFTLLFFFKSPFAGS